MATNRSNLQTLLDQILDLPELVQSELLAVLLDARAQQLGVYQFDAEIEETFARYGA
jgi:hypothetical protein